MSTLSLGIFVHYKELALKQNSLHEAFYHVMM